MTEYVDVVCNEPKRPFQTPDVPFSYCACEGSHHEFLGFVITRNGVGEYDILDDDMWYTINIAKKSSVWLEMSVTPRTFIHTGYI